MVDTAWFTGNYPPQISVEAAFVEGYPTAEDLAHRTQWTTIVERGNVNGDTRNPPFEASSSRRWTHVRLSIYPPDGGVARLRVHGQGLLDPRLVGDIPPLDLAALDNGARVTACSNMFYSSPNNLLLPGTAHTMGEGGWETSRRRDNGNDWVQVQLAGQGGVVTVAELDTSYFLGNAPRQRPPGRPRRRWRLVRAAAPPYRSAARYPASLPAVRPTPPVTDARLEVYPDGGMARLRLFGRLTETGLRRVADKWAAAS